MIPRPRNDSQRWFKGLIFLSSFLIFSVQPILGKYMLPWFGGAPAVWITALLFFQTALVIGYFLAYALSRLSLKNQSVFFIAIAALGILTLPIIPSQLIEGNPIVNILTMLTVAVGLPYTVLAASSPLLQHWTSATGNTTPYKLYAWSNFGSLLGLLSYPFIVEPLLTVESQALVWSILYSILIVGFTLLAVALRKKVSEHVPSEKKESRSVRSDVFWWVTLSMVASIMLLGVTNYITQDIASVPLLWILPLALYLFAFILTFQNNRFYDRAFFMLLFFLFSILGAGVIWLGSSISNILQLGVTLFMLLIFAIVCDGELYRLKPEPSRLTTYYLWISIGGALGGVFVAIIAPLIFPFYFELHAGIIIAIVTVLGLLLSRHRSFFMINKKLIIFYTAATVLSIGAIIVSAVSVALGPSFVTRDFFGSLRIYSEETHKTLYHGHTIHGMQFTDPELTCWPTTYYGYTSGLGRLMELYDKESTNLGVVGLGAGTAAVYADSVRYYELSPSVIRAAQDDFTFLNDCTQTASVQPGDARLSLEHESPQHFDVLVLDAFSSDAIPVHLLTEEAFSVYRKHLNDGGTIAIHISNKYLNFEPLILGIAKNTGLTPAIVNDPGESTKGTTASTWALLTTDESILSEITKKGYAEKPSPNGRTVFWTDERSNIFSLFRVF